MRSNQQKSRSRGRNNNNNNSRRNSNPLSRSYESNGPDVRVRGNAAHVAEKYVQLAQDANQTGDSVAAENYLQHAEHYFRIVSAAQAQVATQQQAQQAAHQAQQAANQARQAELKATESKMPGVEAASEGKPQNSEPTSGAVTLDTGAASGEAENTSAPKSETTFVSRSETTSAPKSETTARARRPRRRPRQDKPVEDAPAPAEQAKSAVAEKPADPAGESASDPAGAPQPDAGELPAFVTNANESSAAE